MIRSRSLLVLITLLLAAIVLQTTLFAQTEYFIPDVVMFMVIMTAAIRLRPEAVLGIAFLAGLAMDLLGSAVLGLRAITFTLVAYAAVRTRDRADLGRVTTGIWVGLLTLGGVVVLVLIGTLFGQTVLLGEGVVRRGVLVPLANTALAWALAPLVMRLLDRDAKSFRFS